MLIGLLELAFVLGLAGLLLFGTIRLLARPQDQSLPASREGHWVTTHYDVKGTTRVVVQKVSPTGVHVLDEHMVATLRIDDPDYDAQFLSAMATARQRQALFESESG
jgi:hypothetical protein